jgi:preprotein translocase subunit SecB
MADNQQADQQLGGEFQIQRIYVKDLSFEAPQSPAVFQQEWKPNLDLQIQTNSNKLADDTYEVVLKVTTTVKLADKVAFLAEVQQAGIFTLRNFNEEQMGGILGGACPSILFPYAREAISDAVIRGTFPPLYLAPVNFDALYLQHLEQQQKQSGNGAHKTDGKIIV